MPNISILKNFKDKITFSGTLPYSLNKETQIITMNFNNKMNANIRIVYEYSIQDELNKIKNLGTIEVGNSSLHGYDSSNVANTNYINGMIETETGVDITNDINYKGELALNKTMPIKLYYGGKYQFNIHIKVVDF